MNAEVPLSVFKLMGAHVGHQVQFVGYGRGRKPPWANLAVECMDCGCIIADWTAMKPPRRRRKK